MGKNRRSKKSVRLHNTNLSEIDRFRQLIERGFSANPWARLGIEEPANNNLNILDESDEEKAEGSESAQLFELTEILFSSAEQAAENLVSASIRNPEIAEALETTVNEQGVKIGKWQIKVKTDNSKGKPIKYFDVCHSITNQFVVKNLSIYEAALALVRYLNHGKSLNSREIQSILRLETQYYSKKVDALTHQVNALKSSKKGEHTRAFVLENRFKESAAKARRIEVQLRAAAKEAL